MKKEVQLTAWQKKIIKWLDNDGVWIKDKKGKHWILKFGCPVMELKPDTFEAIKPYLTIHSFNNEVSYVLTNASHKIKTF